MTEDVYIRHVHCENQEIIFQCFSPHFKLFLLNVYYFNTIIIHEIISRNYFFKLVFFESALFFISTPSNSESWVYFSTTIFQPMLWIMFSFTHQRYFRLPTSSAFLMGISSFASTFSFPTTSSDGSSFDSP